MGAGELIREMGKAGFGAGRVALAVDVYEDMVRNDATIFFGMAGALSPAGMRGLVADMMRRGLISVLVSTGANVVHDLIEAFGGCHYKGSLYVDDGALQKQCIDRIYDIFLPEEHFRKRFDGKMVPILKEVAREAKGRSLSIREFLYEVAKRVPPSRDSFLRTAYECGVPVFVPAIQDSSFSLIKDSKGRDVLGKRLGVSVDAFKDLQEFFGYLRKTKRRGAVLMGGGVPKNFILQATIAVGKPYDYAIQITMDRVETGGLSGASLEEAVSWRKVSRRARTIQVFGDSTIYLPLMVAALLDRLRAKA